MIKVLIADDHPMICFAVQTMLEAEADDYEVQIAHNEDEISSYFDQQTPDVLILDLVLPDIHGLEIINSLMKTNPNTPILVFSNSFIPREIAMAMKAGVLAYLTKDVDSQVLLNAIRAVSQGEPYILPHVSEALVKGLHELRLANGPDSKDTLTPREQDVLILLAKGKSNAQIASLLFISEKTIGAHLHNVMKKFNFGNRRQLFLFAVENFSES